MQVKQIYTLVNQTIGETLGKTDIVKDDLSNLVDIGTQVFNANAVDNYVKSLVDHIGKVIFVDRPYSGSAPSVLMDGWEYGSVCEKIAGDIPDAAENKSWELEDGTSYDPNIFTKPKVSAKFFNSKTTFEVPISIVTKQVQESFSSAESMNRFISMIYGNVDKALTIANDNLIMSTINNAISQTIYSEYQGEDLATKSGVRAINLLKLYNDKFGTTLTAANCLSDLSFLKFATMTIGLYPARLSKCSALFNMGGQKRFTPNDMLHTVFLTDFVKAADVYLQSSTYHNELVKLPKYEEVPYWQGTGTDYQFANVSKINVANASGNDVIATGVLGCMFDRDMLGVANVNKRVTSSYNSRSEFWNLWYKEDAEYFNDFNENMIVFFVA